MQTSNAEFVTLKRSDPNFDKYLMGIFSKDKRAIPVQSLNVNSKAESITFKIIEQNQVEMPALWVRLSYLVRPHLLMAIIIPWLLALINAAQFSRLIMWHEAVFTFLSLLSLLAYMSLRSDVEDHIRGVDRVSFRRGRQVIQKGWFTAQQILMASHIALAVAVASGIPIVLQYFNSIILLAVLGIALSWSYTSPRWAFKYRMISEFNSAVLTFAMCLGLQIIFSKTLIWWDYAFATFWAAWIFILFVFKNFQHILDQGLAKKNSFALFLGFDRAQRFTSWALNILLLTFVGLSSDHKPALAVAIVVLCFPFAGRFIISMRNLSSSGGSHMESLNLKFSQLAYALYGSLIVGALVEWLMV